MSDASLMQRLTRGLLARRWMAGVFAVLLLVISTLLALQSEQSRLSEQSRQATVKAGILAASVTSALAFDDSITAAEHLGALKVDEAVRAAGIYDKKSRLVAGFTRRGEALPERVQARSPLVRGQQLSVVTPVRQQDLQLGHVYLRTRIEPLSARVSRYLGIGIVILLAALLIAVLGAFNAAAAVANRRLQEQIVARERVESELRQSQKMEAIGQLTGGVAHDFNNLLMAASSGLELMERARNEERRVKLKEAVRESLDRGARLTQQLLAFSRRAPLRTEIVDVGRQIGKLAELLDHSLREDISVRYAIEPDLWPIEIDVSQFEVAILNLAVNARDAMPRGGEICISARNRRGALDGEDAVEVSMEDEGTGMSPEAIEKAFEPFFTTKEVGHGTGLGLSQVYGFTRAAGGSASISSEPGSGTVVTMLFPRCSPAAETAMEETLKARSTRIEGLRILLVEDDPSVAMLVGDLLEELGASVERAGTADEALRIFEKHPPDAVLSDMVMPGRMNGLDLARSLRESRPRLPIVLMTGYSEAAGSAAEQGLPVLRKPFNREDLAVRLSQAIERQAPGER